MVAHHVFRTVDDLKERIVRDQDIHKDYDKNLGQIWDHHEGYDKNLGQIKTGLNTEAVCLAYFRKLLNKTLTNVTCLRKMIKNSNK